VDSNLIPSPDFTPVPASRPRSSHCAGSFDNTSSIPTSNQNSPAAARPSRNAEAKLRRKHLDLIVANDVAAPGVGFAHDTNAVLIIGPEGLLRAVPLSDKRTVAVAVLDVVSSLVPSSPHPSPSPETEQS